MTFNQSLNEVRVQTTQIAEGKNFLGGENNEYKVQEARMSLVCFGGGWVAGSVHQLSEGEQ